MRKYLLASAVLACAVPAYAADVNAQAATPVKAAPVACSPTTPMSCSGFYLGGNIAGSGSNLDVLQEGIGNSLLSGGGAFGADAGYRFWNGTYYFGAEVFGDFSELSLGPGLGYKASYLFGEVAKFGMGFPGLFGQAGAGSTTPSQSPTPITVPAGLASALLSPYVQVGAVERPWGVGWAVGAGADFVLAARWNLDLSYLNVQYNNAAINPNVSQQSENIFKVSLNFHL
jgi:opacity protein-like surface antigen